MLSRAWTGRPHVRHAGHVLAFAGQGEDLVTDQHRPLSVWPLVPGDATSRFEIQIGGDGVVRRPATVPTAGQRIHQRGGAPILSLLRTVPS